MQEWDELESDMADAIEIVPEKVIDFIRELVVPKVAFDDSTPDRARVCRVKKGLLRGAPNQIGH